MTAAPEYIAFRSATAEDAERIAAFVLAVAEHSFLREFSPEGQAKFRNDHTLEKTAERLRGNFRYCLAECHGELVALIGMRDNTHLFHLFVSPAHQGQGLARRLWERQKAESLRIGAPAFTVNASVNAVPVYERFGFTASAPLQDVGGVRFIPMKSPGVDP